MAAVEAEEEAGRMRMAGEPAVFLISLAVAFDQGCSSLEEARGRASAPGQASWLSSILQKHLQKKGNKF